MLSTPYKPRKNVLENAAAWWTTMDHWWIEPMKMKWNELKLKMKWYHRMYVNWNMLMKIDTIPKLTRTYEYIWNWLHDRLWNNQYAFEILHEIEWWKSQKDHMEQWAIINQHFINWMFLHIYTTFTILVLGTKVTVNQIQTSQKNYEIS